MMAGNRNIITQRHLSRSAMIYIRQSTPRQVRENTGSTARQYDLIEKAKKLGWKEENITVIDEDQGMSSAAFAKKRSGFQWLAAEVALGHVGAVFGLESSRLARAQSDWHRLLELCDFTDTLIIADDGVYDVSEVDAQLVLGIKGTMSAVELHMIKSRMNGGRLKKAEEGTLWIHLPIGYVYDYEGRVIFDPDQEVQDSLKILFQKFSQLKSARQVVGFFNDLNLQFPVRERKGDMNSPVLWRPLTANRARNVLRNPTYAGAYAYGRKKSKRDLNGNHRVIIQSLGDWLVLIQDHHPAYITWERYLENREQLKMNIPKPKTADGPGVVRDGAALLQGIIYCGKCGRKMVMKYNTKDAWRSHYYVCDYEHGTFCGKICQSMRGNEIDHAIADTFLEAVQHQKLNVALRAIEKLKDEQETLLRQLNQKLERAHYHADRSEQQYNKCDPAHELVRPNLEKKWNEALEVVASIEAEIEALKSKNAFQLTDEQKVKIQELASDLPRIWYNENTRSSYRKRLLRALIADVTLNRIDGLASVTIRWKTGTLTNLEVALLGKAYDRIRTSEEVIVLIRELAPTHIDRETADELNARGLVGGRGNPFSAQTVQRLRVANDILACGLALPDTFISQHGDIPYSTGGLAELFDISVGQVHYLRKKGIITGIRNPHGVGYVYNLNTEDVKALKLLLQENIKNGRIRLPKEAKYGV